MPVSVRVEGLKRSSVRQRPLRKLEGDAFVALMRIAISLAREEEEEQTVYAEPEPA